LATRGDLELVREFFEKVILNVTATVTNAHGVWNDFGRVLAMAELSPTRAETQISVGKGR